MKKVQLITTSAQTKEDSGLSVFARTAGTYCGAASLALHTTLETGSNVTVCQDYGFFSLMCEQDRVEAAKTAADKFKPLWSVNPINCIVLKDAVKPNGVIQEDPHGVAFKLKDLPKIISLFDGIVFNKKDDVENSSRYGTWRIFLPDHGVSIVCRPGSDMRSVIIFEPKDDCWDMWYLAKDKETFFEQVRLVVENNYITPRKIDTPWYEAWNETEAVLCADCEFYVDYMNAMNKRSGKRNPF